MRALLEVTYGKRAVVVDTDFVHLTHAYHPLLFQICMKVLGSDTYLLNANLFTEGSSGRKHRDIIDYIISHHSYPKTKTTGR
jgi:hypothetical protein